MEALNLNGFYKGEKTKEKKDKLTFSKGKKEKIIFDNYSEKDLKLKSKSSKFKAEISKSRAARAGLVFPVARIHSKLKHSVPANVRVGSTAAVFIAAVLEYLVAELCELAGNAARADRKKQETGGKKTRTRINPRAIKFAISKDAEFAELLSTVTLSGGGVVPLSDAKLKEQLKIKDPKDIKKTHPIMMMEDHDDDDDEEDAPMMPEPEEPAMEEEENPDASNNMFDEPEKTSPEVIKEEPKSA